MPQLPERQLQLAVAAVERGLASSDQALQAAAQWLADPSVALGERLRAAAALSAGQMAELEAAVDHAKPEFQPTVVPWRDSKAPPLELPAKLSQRSALITPECPERYEVKGVHGRGGQAAVYVAVDRHLGREVAWKELSRQQSLAVSSHASEGASSFDRFLREARITGQLEHPNIVPVYELGRRADGAFYYTMRLVRGRSLDEALSGKPLPERLRLLGHFRDVCHALAFAHSRGIIHRDVKPANVMVGEFGETVLLDWGIAKVRGSDDTRSRELERRLLRLQDGAAGETLAGDALGTPSYMSPEQAEGRLSEVDERSDVWGLGALLYEILTGEPPYSGRTATEVLAKVSAQRLVPVRERCPEAPAELAAVAEKALRKSRSERYASAGELAEDVTAYMTGLKVAAYAYSSWDLLRRFAARNKALIAAALAVFVAVVAALAVTGVAWRRESAARAREQQARAAETAERRKARFHLAQAYEREAGRLLDENDALAARIYAAASLTQNPAHPASVDPDPAFAKGTPEADWLRVDAISALYQTRASRVERLRGTLSLGDAATRLAFAPDGSALVAGDHAGGLTAWAADTLARRASVLADSVRVRALAVTPDSKQVITGGDDRVIRFWDLERLTPARALAPLPESVSALALDAAHGRLAAGGLNGGLYLIELASGAVRRLEPAHTEEVRDMAFSPDGRTLLSVSWDKTGRLWDMASGRARATLTGHTESIYAGAFSPDGSQVATGAWDGTVRLWEAATGEPAGTLEARIGIWTVAWSPDGRLIAAAGDGGVVKLFDAAGKWPEATARAHQISGVPAVAFHPGGELLATGGEDRTVHLWSLSARGVERLQHTDWVNALAYFPDGSRLVTGGWDRLVTIWDARTGKPLRTLAGHTSGVLRVAVSADGGRIGSASYDGTARLWDAQTGAVQAELKPGHGELRGIAFSPDGTLVALAPTDGVASLWDARTGEHLTDLERVGGSVHNVLFSPDGRLLATADNGRAVRLYDVRERRPARVLLGHADWVSGLAFSPDGRTLASSGKGGEVILWNVADGRRLRTLLGHRDWVDDVAFSPDGRLLASSGEDSRVIVWDAQTGDPLLRLRTRRDAMRIAFSPDGQELAFADFTAAMRYRLELPFTVDDPAAQLAQAQGLAGLRLEGFDLSVAGPGAPAPAQVPGQ